MRLLYIFVFISVVFPFHLFAQTVTPQFRHITRSDGLPSITTYFVIQDSKGYLWITTDHGVARYDGYDFKVFTTKDGLEDNTVFNLFEDTNGRMWMLTFSGKIFYYLDGKIIAYKYNNAAIDFVKGTAPARIYVDASDNVYITCRGELKIDSTGKTTFESESNTNNVLIHEVSDSCILSSCFNSIRDGLSMGVFYKNNSGVDSIFTVPHGYSRVNAVRFNQTDLVFAIGKDFYLFRNGSVIHLFKGAFTEIYFMLKDKSNRIYACTDKGLYIYDDVISSEAFSIYFEDKIVTSCCIDRENGFWVTTRDYGVYYLSDFAIKHFEIAGGMFEKPVCLTSDFKSSVYAAYASGLITQISGSVEKIIYTSSPSKKVYNLFLEEQSKLYIGGDSSGYIYQNIFRPFVNPLIGSSGFTHLKNNYVRHADGLLYSAAQSALIKIANDTVAEHIDCLQRINCLFETNQRQLLLGCINGALLFNDSTRKATLYNSVFTNMNIQDIKQFNFYTCFATQGYGLIFWDGKNKISITESNGLASDFVSNILVHNNDIWCATNMGISHIQFSDANKFSYNITNITTKEGLPSNEINDLVFLNDTIWVATNSGICFFNCQHNFVNSAAPLVYIRSMIINGADTTIKKNYSLPHDYNNLKISFRGISFKSQKEISYRYVLKTDGDSIFGITKNTEVEFLALSAGNYSFYVFAQNSSGIWSKNAAVLSFAINPSWWKTWWFRLIILLVLSASVLAFNRSRVQRIKEKFSLEKKQASLQLTAMRAQMNPHFIFNVMGSIRNYMQKNDNESAEKYLISFAKLVRYTLDNSDIQEVTLEEELNAIREYAFLESKRFQNGFDFEINVEEGIDMDDIMLPSLLLQPFVENAIKHGMERLNGKGHLLIEIKKIKDSVSIAIQDNGVGRSDSSQWNEAIRGKHTSHGSKLTFERVAAYNKAYNQNIKMKVIDLAKADIQGTRVEISL